MGVVRHYRSVALTMATACEARSPRVGYSPGLGSVVTMRTVVVATRAWPTALTWCRSITSLR